MQVSLKLIVFAILFLCLLTELKSKDSLNLRYNTWGIELQSGFAAHDVKVIQNARDKALKEFEFPAKVTDDYPNIPYIQGELLHYGKIFDFGFSFSYVTTGSRVHYADYSGEYKFDDFLSNYEYGLVLKTRSANEYAPFRIQAWGELGISSLKYRTEEILKVNNSGFTKSTAEIKNTVNYIELGARTNYYYNGFYFNCGVSYFAEFSHEIHFIIEDPYDLNFGFSGVRAHLGVGYKF
ncbi:MAG TPA: hypothetical protein PKY56_03470 [Candidatus Kapabacteria bacterium]|nr:hypothetical protein [Candidatus Kapabacteria bacterium]HPO63485.1 hypothetical protein [Candidatus Kapabacteria bacterium]